jgi:hypothetical protein
MTPTTRRALPSPRRRALARDSIAIWWPWQSERSQDAELAFCECEVPWQASHMPGAPDGSSWRPCRALLEEGFCDPRTPRAGRRPRLDRELANCGAPLARCTTPPGGRSPEAPLERFDRLTWRELGAVHAVLGATDETWSLARPVGACMKLGHDATKRRSGWRRGAGGKHAGFPDHARESRSRTGPAPAFHVRALAAAHGGVEGRPGDQARRTRREAVDQRRGAISPRSNASHW